MSPPGRRRRPLAGSQEPQDVVAGRRDASLTVTLPHDGNDRIRPTRAVSSTCERTALKSARLAWIQQYIRRGRAAGEIPIFGSPAWCGLRDTDPRKVAAVVIAAECWAVETDPDTIREQLAHEMACRRQAEARLDAAEWDKATAQVRKINTAPSWAKIQKRWSGEAS